MSERPHIEIKTRGTKSKIFINGEELPGVRGYRFSHYMQENDSLPLLTIDIKATDVTLDTDRCPGLPYPFSAFYELKESIREMEESSESKVDMEPVNIFIDSEELARTIHTGLQNAISSSNMRR